MRFRLLLPALGALVLIVAACAPPPVIRNDKWLHDTSVVTGEACEAPCWRGITPGETSWDEAVGIIEGAPKFAQLNIEEQDQAKLATWQEKDGEPCCRMFTEDGKTVQSIILLLAPESSVGDLVKTYGEPEYVVGSPVTPDQAIMNLFYLDPPMLVYAFVAGEESGALTESSEIIGVTYMSQDLMQQLVASFDLYAWKGYRSYRDYASGEFAVTAVPTTEATEGQ